MMLAWGGVGAGTNETTGAHATSNCFKVKLVLKSKACDHSYNELYWYEIKPT